MGKKTKNCIFFLIGASGSGKTVVCDYLKKHCASKSVGADLAVHDIDEDGLPDFGRGHWRRYRIDELLGNAKRAIAERSSLICGVILPHEVIESDLFEPEMRVYFILLDASSQAISRRLSRRLESKYGKEKSEESARDNIKFSKKLRSQISMQRNGFTVDTRNKSIKQVAEEVLAIVMRVLGSKAR